MIAARRGFSEVEHETHRLAVRNAYFIVNVTVAKHCVHCSPTRRQTLKTKYSEENLPLNAKQEVPIVHCCFPANLALENP